MTMCTTIHRVPARSRLDPQIEQLDLAAINLGVCTLGMVMFAGPLVAVEAAWRTGIAVLVPALLIHRSLRRSGHRRRETALLTAWSKVLAGAFLLMAVLALVPLGFLVGWAMFAAGTEPVLGPFGTLQLVSAAAVLWSLQRAAYQRSDTHHQGASSC